MLTLEIYWCFHELNAYNMYSEAFAEFYYWRLAGGTEVDFIINDMEVAIESKAARKITVKHLKGLRSLHLDHPGVKERLILCCEDKPRITDDGIEIIPAANFTEMLWSGDFF